MGCLFSLILTPLNLAGNILRQILILLLPFIGINIVASNPTPALLYVKHRFDPQAGNGILFEIEGRQPGIIAFIMRILGINNRSIIQVTQEDVRISNIAPFGTYHHVVPLNTITTTHYRLKKRTWLAFAAFVPPIIGVILLPGIGFFIGLVFTVIFLLMYWFTREMVIGFSTGDVDGIAGLSFFKKGLAGRNITHKELVQIFAHVDRSIIQAHQTR